MAITKQTCLWFATTAGALVLTSYAIGLLRMDAPDDAWGGVDGTLRLLIMGTMPLAAAGFVTYFVLLFFKSDSEVIANLHWPWANPDGKGASRLLLGLAWFLIPSMFWLEATILHLRVGAIWTQVLTIATLGFACVGIAKLLLLALGAIKDKVPLSKVMMVGLAALGVQCIVMDFVIWNLMFPW